jgi:DNA-binding LacI/PurR family transcriptional regulator
MQQIGGLLNRQNGKKKPLYEQIGHQLRRDIEVGRISVGERLPSPSRLVEQWKVDYRTVNLALKILEREGLIKSEQKRGAGAMVVNRSTVKYALMYVRWNQDALVFDIEAGIKRYASDNSIDVVIVDAFQSHEMFINSVLHPTSDVKGIVVLPAETPAYREAVLSAIRSGVRVVFVDRVLPGISVSAVLGDDVGGAYQATRHLLDRYGLPVYYFGHTGDPSSLRNRVLGWAAAMGAYNFTDLESYIIELPKTEWELGSDLKIAAEEHHKVAVQFFKNHSSKKNLIFAANDYIARSVYTAADEVGLKIGENVYIAGFSDFPFAAHLPVPLTSVRQPNEMIGYEAARVLCSEIVEEVKQPIHRILPVDLIVRASSGGEV